MNLIAQAILDAVSARTQDESMGGGRPGRPKVKTEKFYASLLDEFERMALAYEAETGNKPKSDIKLLQYWTQKTLTESGMRLARANSHTLAGRIKTLRNHLSEARGVLLRPQNTSFSGMCNKGYLGSVMHKEVREGAEDAQ